MNRVKPIHFLFNYYKKIFDYEHVYDIITAYKDNVFSCLI